MMGSNQQSILMPPQQSNVFNTRQFSHKGNSYDISAYTKPTDPYMVFVDVAQGGNPVIYTYPDGFQAKQEHCVELTTAFDLYKMRGINAVTALMDDAEEQVKRWV